MAASLPVSQRLPEMGEFIFPSALGSATPDATTFLRGDGQWATPPGGAGSAQPTSAQFSALSQNVSVISNALSNEISNRISADNALSQAISVVSQAVSVVSNALSNEISNRTSADNVLSTAISVVSNAVSNEISNRTSADNALSNAINIVSTAASNALSVANAASNAASIVSVAVNAVSNNLSTLCANLSAISAVSGATSVDGIQSVVNQLSNRTSVLSNAISVVSNAVSIVSTAASNALSVANAASNAASIVSARLQSLVTTDLSAFSINILSLQSTVSNLRSAVSGVSATSAGGGSATGLQAVVDALSNKISTIVAGAQSVTSAEYVSTLSVISHLKSAVSNVSAQSAGGSTTGLQAVVDMLSNKISQVGGTASVTSAELASVSALSVGVSVRGLQSAINALSNTISDAKSVGTVNNNILSAAIGRVAFLTAAAVVSAAALTTVTGLSLEMSISTLYEFRAVLLYSTSVGQPIGWGMNFPAMVNAGGNVMQQLCVSTSNPTQSIVNAAIGYWQTGGSGSLLLSAPSPGVTGQHPVVFNGMFFISNASGTLHMLAKASTGTGQIVILQGSYIRLAKIA